MQIVDSKSLLAKLMATENLTIEHSNVRTASFDTKNRILTVPTLDDNISGYLYDLFLGHEVGHALYTPMEGLRKALELGIPNSISNVVEDARIERKIKYKYPGIRSSFVKGYNELIEKDFFETKGLNLNMLNFIDRANLYFKGGASRNIRFTEYERELLDQMDTTETYEDVIELSIRIKEYLKQESEKQKKNVDNSADEEDEFDFDNEDLEEDFEPSMDDGEEGEESDEDESKSGDLDRDEKEVDKKAANYGDTKHNNNNSDIEAFTDKAFSKNQEQLFADKSSNYLYADIPKIDINEAIMDHKVLWKKHKDYYTEFDYLAPTSQDYLKIRKELNKSVSYLAKEFEMRKNADQLKRASIAKTGELNMSKIFSYQFSEDIFKRLTVVPNGKSHGLVMFLDWSGSMCDHMLNTVKQLFALTLFCRKVNIPFEVYAFSQAQGYGFDYRPTPVVGQIKLSSFVLFNLLSSRMNSAEYTYACVSLTNIGKQKYRVPSFMSLGGTPLNEAVISAMEIIPHFQKKYKLQVVNTVFLTDGEGHNLYERIENVQGDRVDTSYAERYGPVPTVMVIRDPKTKHTEIIKEVAQNQTKHFVKLLKASTGCNVIGFYVLTGREFGRVYRNFFSRTVSESELKSKFRSDKFLVINNAGYDDYYLLRTESLDTEDSTFEVKENVTHRGLVSAFSKYTSGRVANKVVLNRFINLIT